MFKPLIIFGNELLRTDYARIRKIARAIFETADAADFKIFFALFYNNFSVDDFDTAFLGADLTIRLHTHIGDTF